MSDIPNKDWNNALKQLSKATEDRLHQIKNRGDKTFAGVNDLIELKTRYASGERTLDLYVSMMKSK